MSDFQEDYEGQLSCRNRQQGFHCKDWCTKHKDFCNYCDDLEPIQTRLSLLRTAAEELAEASARLVRFAERKGYGSWDLAATRAALVAVETALNNLEDGNAQR